MKPLLALAAAIAMAGCHSPERTSPEAAAPVRPEPAAGPPRVVHFYAYPSSIARGETARLCYGVTNATTARVEPHPGAVPAYENRCFEISPSRTTDYVLTAEGTQGRRVTRAARITVGARAAPPATEIRTPEAPPKVRVTSFSASASDVARGAHVTLCYSTADASEVRIDPPVVDFRLPARGCFGHEMSESTTFRLTASGVGGTDSREVSVKVR